MAVLVSFFAKKEKLLEGRFCLLNQSGKIIFVEYGEVSQDLSVQLDAGGFQAVHEAAVAQAADTGTCVDTQDPELAEIASALFAALKRVLH